MRVQAKPASASHSRLEWYQIEGDPTDQLRAILVAALEQALVHEARAGEDAAWALAARPGSALYHIQKPEASRWSPGQPDAVPAVRSQAPSNATD